MTRKSAKLSKVDAPVNLPVVNTSRGLVSGAVDHLAARALPYLAPWAGAAVLPPALGGAAHAMWNDSVLEAGLACGAMGLAGVALSAVTWKTASGTNGFRKFRRAQATASVAAGMGWLTCATAAGPLAPGVLDTWLFGGALFAASWNIRQVLRNAVDETEPVEEKGGMGKLAEAVGLEKFQLRRVKNTGKGVVTADLAVPASKTVEDAQAAAPRIAAALNLPPNGVTITRNGEDAGLAHAQFRVADLLKDGVRYEMPREYGLLPTEPIPVGLYADGDEVLINPFAQDILQHLMVMGVTGAGKSEFARTVLSHLMTRRKLSIWLVDLAKGRQTVGHIASGLDWFVQDPREAKLLVRCLPAVISARGSALADEGLDQWTPKSKLNAMVVWLEEAADVADFEELEKIARAARSVGIWLVVSLQRATWGNLSTDVRANLQASACFGVDDAGDAGFCLPDKVTEAGAIPDWGSDRPGYAYATGMGIPAGKWTTEWRGAYTGEIKDLLAAVVEKAARFRDPLDEVSARAAGAAYAQRTHQGSNRTTPGAVPLAAVPDRPTATDHTDQEEAVAEEIREVYAEVMGMIPDPPEGEDYDVRIEDEVPERELGEPMALAQRERKSTEEARAILYGEIDGWCRTGRLTFQPADLIPATTAAGRKRPWLQLELKKLVERGAITRDGHGEYTIVQSPLVPA
ncbi:hypothetical protein [Streptomyces mangrovi]|uniref:hypothetical protein n=1 Tax=Streptomyces mangrovi TaxID=1206892 RepID=UPI00399D2FA9